MTQNKFATGLYVAISVMTARVCASIHVFASSVLIILVAFSLVYPKSATNPPPPYVDTYPKARKIKKRHRSLYGTTS